MLMIIAPSKTQDLKSSVVVAGATQPLFLADSELLIRELGRLSVEELSELMGMSERLAQQTHQRIHDFKPPFTHDNARPALTVFQGDVYSRIAVMEYGQKEMEYVQEHLCILSGLYGLLRPLDLMQSYRLEMGCRLPNERGGNLYDFWREKVSSELNRRLSDHPDPTLVNLASTEYSRVINKKELKGDFLEIDFKERKGDTFRTVAIHAKRARGMMVDFAVKGKVETAAELKNFHQDGYGFQKELSGENHFVFTRG